MIARRRPVRIPPVPVRVVETSVLGELFTDFYQIIKGKQATK